MPSKANQPKTSLAQRNFHIAKATRFLSRIYRAIDEENFNFNFEPLKVELMIILADVEESTLFLLDNLPENTTANQLIADFTKIQNEHDDLTETFSSMVQHASANRPEETCNNRNEVHLQTYTDATIADASGQTLAVDNHTVPSIQKLQLIIRVLLPQMCNPKQTRNSQRLLQHWTRRITLSLISLDRN